ncbi:microsomal signal peptidase 12 kDa subunit [Coprinellus micaceus]|uniref:Signal peptidase complex subunit 1 n=1 Tax=Coprinellus micaceus TaxID=71717 RepID=A0A4Y7SUR9_COPMI|nr:microsomal signal peptidase 12 kDa subunit [Coprinellus micaceus]
MTNALADLAEGKIDFAGQRHVEQVAKVTLVAGAAVSFIAGFALQDLRVTFGLYGAIVVLLALVALPPWPMYNRHPVKWLSTKP